MQNGSPDLSQVSGPQLHVMSVVNGLKKQGHAVHAVATQANKLRWTEDFQSWSMPRYGITSNKLFKLIESMIRRIQSELKLPFIGLFDSLRFSDASHIQLRDADILYERHGYMGFGGVLAARRLGIPLILELNGNILKEIDERKLLISNFQRRVGQWITRRTFLSADHIVVVSDALGQTLINEYQIPSEKISVVLNGVEIDLFSTRQVEDDVRSQFGLLPGPIIGFVGTFEPWHGVDLLVTAFQEVVLKHPNTQLVIIGDGPGKEAAIAEAGKLGIMDKVMFLGRLPHDQVAAVLGIAKILVAPYPFEYNDIVGTPLKIMEYMACGKGIVASTTPLHEMVEHGVTGLRVPPANAHLLAEGINCLLEDDELCNILGRNAAMRSKQYSWEEVCIKLEELFLQEINKKSSQFEQKNQIQASPHQ